MTIPVVRTSTSHNQPPLKPHCCCYTPVVFQADHQPDHLSTVTRFFPSPSPHAPRRQPWPNLAPRQDRKKVGSHPPTAARPSSDPPLDRTPPGSAKPVGQGRCSAPLKRTRTGPITCYKCPHEAPWVARIDYVKFTATDLMCRVGNWLQNTTGTTGRHCPQQTPLTWHYVETAEYDAQDQGEAGSPPVGR